jgi:hypothetical protein
MKTMIRVLLVTMLAGSVATAKAAPSNDINMINTKFQHLFVFKAKRKYLGATVEVYYSNGDLITSEKLGKRRMIIDFCDTKLGEYTIRVVKDDKRKEFSYIKK